MIKNKKVMFEGFEYIIPKENEIVGIVSESSKEYLVSLSPRCSASSFYMNFKVNNPPKLPSKIIKVKGEAPPN